MTTALKTTAPSWSCDRCRVSIRWMEGHEQSGPPQGWSHKDGATHCLACRRDLAAETAFEEADEGSTREDRAKLRARARVEFELNRDPERPNAAIAKALRCSPLAVHKARQRLEAEAKSD